MAWPTLLDFVPVPLHGGPIPAELEARARQALREAWRRHVAKRVHGADQRALALVALPDGDEGPFCMLYDGRTLEWASAAAAPARTPEVPPALASASGLLLRQPGLLLWRESLNDDTATARWRTLGGDEAFGVTPQATAAAGARRLECYAIVRRGSDRVRLDLGHPARFLLRQSPMQRWAERQAPMLREDVRKLLLG